MKSIIEKAIQWGYNPSDETNYRIETDAFGHTDLIYWDLDYPDEGSDVHSDYEILMDSTFWEALGKATKWNEGYHTVNVLLGISGKMINNDTNIALRFHEINLTQGFPAAVEYLSNLVEKV